MKNILFGELGIVSLRCRFKLPLENQIIGSGWSLEKTDSIAGQINRSIHKLAANKLHTYSRSQYVKYHLLLGQDMLVIGIYLFRAYFQDLITLKD